MGSHLVILNAAAYAPSCENWAAQLVICVRGSLILKYRTQNGEKAWVFANFLPHNARRDRILTNAMFANVKVVLKIKSQSVGLEVYAGSYVSNLVHYINVEKWKE